MAIKTYYGARGFLASSLDSLGTVLTVTSSLSEPLSSTFINGTDTTYLSLRVGSVSEVVRVLNVAGNSITVERGPTAYSFPVGTEVEFVLTSAAIIGEIAELGVYPYPTLEGDGLVQVTAGTPTTIEVLPPDFEGVDGVNIRGKWPSLIIGYSAPENECCPGSGGGGGDGGTVTGINGGGIIDVYNSGGGTYDIYANEPSFSGGGGIEVTGSWPYYSIEYTGGSSGSGTVTSVATAAGLQLTGNPNVNPTISIANTGVAAGDYAGFVVNARGQITQIPAGFAPISTIEGTDSTIVATRTGATVTLDVIAAAIGQPGVVALADETDPYDPTNNTLAATPAVIAAALAASPKSSLAGASSFLGESDGAYLNTISGSATAIELLAGEKAIVYGECLILDTVTETNAPLYGLAVFSADPARVKSTRKIPQCLQSISFVMEGPVNTSLALVTTELTPGTHSLTSWSLWVTKIG